MTDRLTGLLADLDAESSQLDSWVRALEPERWRSATPAAGWTIAHQIAHLHWTDTASAHAIDATLRGVSRDSQPAYAADGDGATEFEALMRRAAADPTGFVDAAADGLAQIPPAELLTQWRGGRSRLADALRGVADGTKIAWFGPPMSPASMATARLMETWAHGHDVAESLGIDVPVTDRVRHVCHLGVRARAFAYIVRGLELPDTEIQVRLEGPGGETWTWGPDDATETVTGSAWDFALLATRRRHLDDVDVRAAGPNAQQWLTIIQAFAGPPGRDPQPRGSEVAP